MESSRLSYMSGFTAVAAAILLALSGKWPVLVTAVLVVAGLLLAGGWGQIFRVPSLRFTGCFVCWCAVIFPLLQGFGGVSWLAKGASLSVLGAFLLEMFRRPPRPRLIESVSANLTALLVVLCGCGWLFASSYLSQGDSKLYAQFWVVAFAILLAVPGGVISDIKGAKILGFGALASSLMMGLIFGLEIAKLAVVPTVICAVFTTALTLVLLRLTAAGMQDHSTMPDERNMTGERAGSGTIHAAVVSASLAADVPTNSAQAGASRSGAEKSGTGRRKHREDKTFPLLRLPYLRAIGAGIFPVLLMGVVVALLSALAW